MATNFDNFYTLDFRFIGIIVEFLPQIWNTGGVISLSAFTLYFGGFFLQVLVVGLYSCIFSGIILLLVEMFVLDLVYRVFWGLLLYCQHYISFILHRTGMSIVIAILLTIIAGVRYLNLRRYKFFDRITLSTSLSTKVDILVLDYSEYVGKTGASMPKTRKYEIDGRKLDAVSEGTF